MLDYDKFPNRNMIESLKLYFEKGIEPGSFLTAVLNNDLRESFAQADHINAHLMKDIVLWMYREAPSPSWGSPEKVEAWMACKQGTDR